MLEVIVVNPQRAIPVEKRGYRRSGIMAMDADQFIKGIKIDLFLGMLTRVKKDLIIELSGREKDRRRNSLLPC
jgi:hypothetical protein